MSNVINFFSSQMICGWQLHKTDIGKWHNFIFLNTEIDVCVLIAEAKRVFDIFSMKIELNLSIKFSLYSWNCSVYLCTPWISHLCATNSSMKHDWAYNCYKYTMGMNDLHWLRAPQSFPWKLSVMIKCSLLSVQTVIKSIQEKIQNSSTPLQ